MNVKLYMHDGLTFEENIQDFDLEKFIESINTDQHKMIRFGSKGIMKTAVKMIDANPLSTEGENE